MVKVAPFFDSWCSVHGPSPRKHVSLVQFVRCERTLIFCETKKQKYRSVRCISRTPVDDLQLTSQDQHKDREKDRQTPV